MRLTVIGLVVLGLFAAICAAVLVAALRVQRPSVVVGGPGADVEIVVAAHPLPAMTVVDAASVQVRTVAEEEVPVGAIQSATAIIGKVIVVPMVEGQAFTATTFAREGSGVHLAAVLKDGHRAMSVPLQDFSGLEGLLYPGSVVDVLASFRVVEEGEDGTMVSGDLISTVLLEAVQVLAIEDQTILTAAPANQTDSPEGARASNRRRVVTLLVDPRQAEALQLASGHGTIALTLRNPLDQAHVDRRGTSFFDISPYLGGRLAGAAGRRDAETAVVVELPAAPPAAPAEPPAVDAVVEPPPRPQWQTTVIRGAATATQNFDLPEHGAHLSRGTHDRVPGPPR